MPNADHTAAVLTISDTRSSAGDRSGPAVAEMLSRNGFAVVTAGVIHDDRKKIEHALRRLSSKARLVVTTGGTGLAPRDVTPEATRAVCERLVEGLAEQMRAAGARQTPFAALSRAVCGTLGATLIVNLPGSPEAAVHSLAAIIAVLPHALDLLAGNTAHK